MAAPRLDDQLCFQLYTGSRLVVRAYRPLLQELGITYPQYLVLMVLWQSDDEDTGAETVSALGSRLHLDSGTLTPLLKRLEALGFVTRNRTSSDERVVHIGLTDCGRELAKKAGPMRAKLMCDYAGDRAGLGTLREALRALNGALLTG
jgi:MarR family transcriptional regulator, organic hydroperoxide resistance regulator